MRIGQVLIRRERPSGTLRTAQVVRVLGVNAGPPFLVRWLDSGKTSLLYPDSDIWPRPRTHSHAPEQRGNRCG